VVCGLHMLPPSLTPQKRGVGMRRRACAPSTTPRCRCRCRTLQRTTTHPSLSPCPPPSPVINELRGMMTSVIVVPLLLLSAHIPLPLPCSLPLLPCRLLRVPLAVTWHRGLSQSLVVGDVALGVVAVIGC
jgi:hypothetical protein